MKLQIGFLGFVMAVLATFAHGQEIILKVSHFLPPNSAAQKDVLEPWCNRINKESRGRLKCQFYPAMQLGGTPAQLVDQVRNGVADIVWTAPSYSTGRFPIIEAVELPFVMPADGLAASRAMWEFYNTYARKEFEAYKVLAIDSGGGQVLNTANRPLLDLGSFKGVKLRAPSKVTSELLVALGATPVSVPAAQLTEAVSKGVVDGALAPWELVSSVKLDEVTKFHTEPPPGQPAFAAVALVVLMNKGKYEELPAELKAVLDKNSGPALVDAFGMAWDRAIEAARKRAQEQGNKVTAIKPADYLAMRKAATGVEQQWVKNASAKGLDAPNLVSAVRSIGSKYLAK